MEENINTLLKDYVDKLNLIREDYKRLKNLELVSIRRDLVAIELKDILEKSNNYSKLSENVSNYIINLMEVGEDTNGK